MPHITFECTSNVDIDFAEFCNELSQSLVATGHAKAMGIKCRKVSSDDYYIIDGGPDFKMVNLLFRLREGRSVEIREQFSQIGMDLLQKHLEADVKAKKIILSTEVKELMHGLDLTMNSVR